MTIAKYCKEKNFSKEEYKNFKNNIEEIAKTIRSGLKYNGGMYYNADDLFNKNIDNDIKHMIINELKKSEFSISDIKTSKRTKKSPLPFTTSTLQQEAAKVLNFPSFTCC